MATKEARAIRRKEQSWQRSAKKSCLRHAATNVLQISAAEVGGSDGHEANHAVAGGSAGRRDRPRHTEAIRKKQTQFYVRGARQAPSRIAPTYRSRNTRSHTAPEPLFTKSAVAKEFAGRSQKGPGAMKPQARHKGRALARLWDFRDPRAGNGSTVLIAGGSTAPPEAGLHQRALSEVELLQLCTAQARGVKPEAELPRETTAYRVGGTPAEACGQLCAKARCASAARRRSWV